MRRMLCLCNICFNIRVLFGKSRFTPILNNRFDDKSKTKTLVEDRKSSHRLGDYWWSRLGCTPRMTETVGDRPDVLGDRPNMRGPLSRIGHMGRGIRCLRFRSAPERTCKWTVCLTLDFSLCDWFLLNIYLFGGGEFILLLNALLWDVRAQRLYIDGHGSYGVNCLCSMPKWQIIKVTVEKQSLVVDDQSTACVAQLCV